MTSAAEEIPSLVRALHKLQVYLSQDFLGGPRWLKMSWVINFQKGGTLVFVLLLMFLFGNFGLASWVYLALHGSYGICWIIKHFAYKDRKWDTMITFGGAFMCFALTLGLYWAAPFLIVSGISPAPSLPLVAVCIILHTLGVAIMLSADAQKFFSLKVKTGLITDGMFKHIRHPNYLGEMMIYGTYALLAQHIAAWLILAWVWLAVFLPNMVMKEISLSRFSEWKAYKARTGFLLPKFFGL